MFFHFSRAQAGYVTAEKGKTDKKEHKKASTTRGQCNHFFRKKFKQFLNCCFKIMPRIV